jgi:phosphatidylinositol alpha-mannosyltransferase
MRIAITTPTAWPRVRRGVERFFDEMAAFLAGRGHDVTVISAKPGRKEVVRTRGFTIVNHRRLWHPALARAGLLEFHAFFLRCLPSLLRRRYDVVVSGTFLDAYAAILARRVRGARCLALVNAIPPPVRYFRSLTLKGAIFRRAMAGADEVLVPSGFIERYVEERFGRKGRRLPVPVDLARFPLAGGRDHDRPVILCAAALDDERKGGSVLFRAFDRVKRRRGTAVLRIASAVTGATRARLLALVDDRFHGDVEFVGAGDPEDLARTYGRSAVCVLPSLWEAFGMVLVESMATGTPVVGTRDGAIPEIIDDGVGRLFDPGPVEGAAASNDEGLAAAIIDALDLSRRPETPARCRAFAEQFGWDRLGPRYETLLAELAARTVRA